MLNSVVVFVAMLLGMLVLFSHRVRASEKWQATVTPLASIIGSGFLVSVPIIAKEIGHWAIIGISGLILAAYCVGAVIRFNILYTEQIVEQQQQEGRIRLTTSLEKLSQLTLAFAYFISIAYYLVLLGNFLLKGFGYEHREIANWIGTVLTVFIGLVGFSGGLHLVERVEKYAVSLNLTVIFGLLVGLLFYNGELAFSGQWEVTDGLKAVGLEKVQIMLGLLIVVQGFETSKFIGDEYSPKMRAETMRNAQLYSAVIYLCFFALLTVLFPLLKNDESVSGIITLVGHVAIVLPLLLTLGAVASQFGASVADSIGSAGLLEDVTNRRVKIRHAYPFITFVSVTLIWSTDILHIITLSSRAFALFYMLQCCVALTALWQLKGMRNRVGMFWFTGATGLLCALVVLFGIPSGA
ncbi:hypothetical protein SAMN05444141_103157 [Pseudovibrio denitrificans]|uniref:Uncharacterized protein n=1 Tax=Pseudovibrio denitrificans TaxID=258256 RepID=A0A1I7AKN8_9HYPH|nr:hypothetical protein [Pseudovibrio denitrificans]SFT75476.1 hypothetical protein SAMN05444141_103157 [Pseudovibrio denitrificans]